MQNMKRVLSIVVISVLILLVFTTTGCSRATRVGGTAWFALLEKGAYQLGDGSGNIWVVTSQPPPQEGQSISAKGNVQAAFSIAGQSYGTVLVETQRD